MKLIHKHTGLEAKIGDVVRFPKDARPCRILYFKKPHKPASEGHVTVADWNGQTHERYCGVFGLEWIDREDRQEDSLSLAEGLEDTSLASHPPRVG